MKRILLLLILSSCCIHPVTDYSYQNVPERIKNEAWKEAELYVKDMRPEYKEHSRTDFFNGYMKARYK